MSYCRLSDPNCDVYIYVDSNDHFHCCGCPLAVGDDFEFAAPTRAEMLTHMQKHVEAGQRVPARAFERMRAEIAEGKP